MYFAHVRQFHTITVITAINQETVWSRKTLRKRAKWGRQLGADCVKEILTSKPIKWQQP